MSEEMKGRFTERKAALDYMLAGNATITAVSTASRARFTFKVVDPKDEDGATSGRRLGEVRWVRLLTGSDNENSFAYLGTLSRRTAYAPPHEVLPHWSYAHGKRSKIDPRSDGARAFAWLAQVLTSDRPGLPPALEVWHEGRCGRCGRKLTVPASIESGFGPECAGKVARSFRGEAVEREPSLAAGGAS